MNLVDELIKDHADLVGVLSKVKAIGISNNESRSILSNAKNALIGHLKKEDAKFYPPLKQAAETDKSLKILLDIFGKDMDEVTHAAMEFFDKHTGANATNHEQEFSRDFGSLMARLGKRIKDEETRLYPEYNKIVK